MTLNDYPIADIFPYIDTMVIDVNENSGSKIIGSTAGEISIDGKTVSRRNL